MMYSTQHFVLKCFVEMEVSTAFGRDFHGSRAMNPIDVCDQQTFINSDLYAVKCFHISVEMEVTEPRSCSSQKL